MTIFCQTCYDATKDVTKSVHDVNTNGSCAKCGSMQVLDAEILMKGIPIDTKAISKAIVQAETEQVYRREPRRIQSNTDFIRQEDIREFLIRYGFHEVERQWDGTYFEHHLWFLVEPTYGGCAFSIMVENRDGSQKEARFDVVLEVKS